MASKNQTQQADSAPRGRGRPPKGEGADPRVAALQNMQYATDRACGFVADASTSMAKRAARCARQGIPRAKVEAAFVAVEEALADARAAAKRAYETPEAPAARAQRVNLLE